MEKDLGLFSKARDKGKSPGWYPTAETDVVVYFDGSQWGGRARLSGLDDQGPIPIGTAAQATQDLDAIRSNINAASNELSEVTSELESFKIRASAAKDLLSFEITNLASKKDDTQKNHYLEEVNFRDYPTAADGSEAIAAQIKELRESQRKMINAGMALNVHGPLQKYFSSLEVINPKNHAFIAKTFTALFLKSFNTESEMAVRQLRRDSSYEPSYNRILAAYTAIGHAGRSLGISISNDYLRLRMDECNLVFQHLSAKSIERLERTAERERVRDEQKAQADYTFALIQFDKELEHYRIMLARMQELGDHEAVARYAGLITGIEEQAAAVRLRAQNIRAGYVYIISNIGSFGDGIVKIGLTRRLEPMDRVKELSSASVPFRYDVHALYFSQDAVSLETALHHHFEDRRVNKINRRREFFYATPHEVLQALKVHDVDLVEWVQDPEAIEFRLTQGQLIPNRT